MEHVFLRYYNAITVCSLLRRCVSSAEFALSRDQGDPCIILGEGNFELVFLHYCDWMHCWLPTPTSVSAFQRQFLVEHGGQEDGGWFLGYNVVKKLHTICCSCSSCLLSLLGSKAVT